MNEPPTAVGGIALGFVVQFLPWVGMKRNAALRLPDLTRKTIDRIWLRQI